MPSFDVVSEVDSHELSNAIDQANREITNRFDFKGTDAKIEHSDEVLTLHAEAEFQIKQMVDILTNALARRGVDVACLDKAKVEIANMRATQKITVRQGVDKELARKIVKQIKDSKIKVQAAVQGDQVRISGKKRDDLQSVISVLRDGTFDLPLQFTNFRD